MYLCIVIYTYLFILMCCFLTYAANLMSVFLGGSETNNNNHSSFCDSKIEELLHASANRKIKFIPRSLQNDRIHLLCEVFVLFEQQIYI